MTFQTDEPTGRTARLLLRVTPQEKALIERNAADLGMGLSAYLRAVGLGRRVTPRRPAVSDEAIRHLAQLGNNLNQIARRANSGLTLDADHINSVLKAVLDAVRRLE